MEEIISSRDVSKDNIFSILSSKRRRCVSEVLSENNTGIPVKELAQKVVSKEKSKPPSQVTTMERKSVYVSLYQNHLKKMDRLNAIEYNQKTNKIEDINKNFLEIYNKIEQQL